MFRDTFIIHILIKLVLFPEITTPLLAAKCNLISHSNTES